MSYNNSETKGERRDKKKRNRRKMRVDGTNVRLLNEITIRNAKRAKKRLREWGDEAT